MLSRQESSLSSTRRQAAAATSPPETNHSKAIGCMSGIFQLFSKYQKSNKRITFGRKHEKSKQQSGPSPIKAKAAIIVPAKEDKIENQIFDMKRLSCEVKVPRSPTIPPEIRRSNSSESPRTTSSLVARLMGLEDYNVISSTVKKPVIEETSNVEKRQRLLQALEKCNDDLEDLKRIIQAVQLADRLQLPQVAAEKCGDENVKKCTDVGVVENRNPVCEVDKFTRSPPSRFSNVQISAGSVRVLLRQPKPSAIKKAREDGEPIGKHLLFSNYTTSTEPSLTKMRRQAAMATSPRRSSRAMVQSVEQVCSDIDWGQKREIRRIGLVLQDYLCKDLVEELVKEMMKSCSVNYSLPLEGCKRRLCF